MFKIISRSRFERMQEKIRDLSDACKGCGQVNEELMAAIAEAEPKVRELQREINRVRQAYESERRQKNEALERAGAAEKEAKVLMVAMDAISAANNRELLGVGLEALVKEGLA